MIESKICQVCSTPIFKKCGEGTRDWDNRKFCSTDCAYIGRKTNLGRRWSEATRLKMSIAKKGMQLWLGKTHSHEARQKMSAAKKGMKFRLGKRHSEATKRQISENKKRSGVAKLDRNPNWRGGKSFEPYNSDFGLELKAKIKYRDNHQCQECGTDIGLCIHHIDYNKLNSNPSNLITLCRSCHSKTNFTRENWTNHFRSKLTNATKLTFQLEYKK